MPNSPFQNIAAHHEEHVKLSDSGLALPVKTYNWPDKPTASKFGVGQAWFGDIGAMGYSDGVDWTVTTDLNENIISANSVLSVDGAILAPFSLRNTTEVNSVTGYCAITHAGSLVEIGIYDSTFTLLTSTGIRNTPNVGYFEFAHPAVSLTAGDYYYAMMSSSATASYAHTTGVGGFKMAYATALPVTATGLVPIQTYLKLNGVKRTLPAVSNFEELPLDGYRWYGKDDEADVCYGWLNSPSKIVTTTDGGENVTQLMSAPSTSGSFILDIIQYGGKLYVLAESAKLYQSSNLTAGATWTTITAPISAGLRRSVAISRTYGIAVFNDYIFYGEYSSATNLEDDPTDPGPPRILKYGPLSGTPTWTLALQTSNARHIHSLWTDGTNELYASVGDGSYGSGIGLYRLNDLATNTFTQVSKQTSPFTNNYPVDFVKISGDGCKPGIYGAADIVGHAVHYIPTDRLDGMTNIEPAIFRISGLSGETSRSIICDLEGNRNLYWFTSETADPALYVSPPPYTHSVRLAANTYTVSRSTIQNGYLLNGQKRYKIAKFIGQENSDTFSAITENAYNRNPVILTKDILNTGYLVPSLAAADAATYAVDGSRKIVVTSTSHGIPSTQNGASVYLVIGSGDAVTGWFKKFTYIDANSFSCIAPALVTTGGTVNSNTSITEITPLSVTIPGGIMGVNKRTRYSTLHMQTNSGNVKTLTVKFGGATIETLALASFVTVFTGGRSIINRNAYDAQITEASSMTAGGASTSSPIFTTVDTSVDTTLTFSATIAAANEYLTVHSVTVEVL